MANNKLIRNSTTEFLIFTSQAGENSIEARYEDETIWLSQKLMATLFKVDVRTINEHLKNIYTQNEQTETATIRKFRIVTKSLEKTANKCTISIVQKITLQLLFFLYICKSFQQLIKLKYYGKTY